MGWKHQDKRGTTEPQRVKTVTKALSSALHIIRLVVLHGQRLANQIIPIELLLHWTSELMQDPVLPIDGDGDDNRGTAQYY